MRSANFSRVEGLDTKEFKAYKNCMGYFLIKESPDEMVMHGPSNIKIIAKLCNEIRIRERGENITLNKNVFIDAYFNDLKRQNNDS